MEFLKFEYWNSCNLDTYYQDGFKQVIWLNSDLIASEASIEEDGSEDQNNEFNATFKKYENRYQVETVCSEPLLDALAEMQLCDNVFVYRKTGESARVKNISIVPDWIFTDCYADTKIEFNVDYFTFDPCCGNPPCEVGNPTIDSYLVGGININLIGQGIDGYIRVQELIGGVWTDIGNLTSVSLYESGGVTVEPTFGQTTLRVWNFSDDCDYGYSEPLTVCMGMKCEVSPGAGLKSISIKGTLGKEITIIWG
ncbi:unnamed protein product, partial [marine sediment metagenome]